MEYKKLSYNQIKQFTKLTTSMKKLTLTITLIIISALSLEAQPLFPGKENMHCYYGGENGKNYAAIFSTINTSRQESILQCVEYLSKYDLVDNKDAVLASVKEYDDSQNEFTVPVDFRFGWHGSAPTMGAQGLVLPMYLTADLLFQFYDNGKFRLVIKNLREKTYFTNPSKSNNKAPDTFLSEEDQGKLKNYIGTACSTDGLGHFFAKILVWANAGLNRVSEVDKAFEDFLSNIDDQITLANKLVEGGHYLYGTPEDAIAHRRKALNDNDADLTINAAQTDYLEKEIAEGKLVCVYPYFWKRDIKLEFDYTFIEICKFFEGTIDGIAEDGEVTWELVDGKLLPTDAKLRKQLIKNKQDYFSYYGN